MALEVGTAYISRIFADAAGYTGLTYYFRIIRRGDNQIWDNVAEEFSADTTWANSAISMTDSKSNGQYPVIIPAAMNLGGTYEIIIYQQASSAPANTDDVETTYEQKHGSIFGF